MLSGFVVCGKRHTCGNGNTKTSISAPLDDMTKTLARFARAHESHWTFAQYQNVPKIRGMLFAL